MALVGRTYSAGSQYRYGFNRQEKSLEIDPGGNLTTATFWEYDSRIGRRWNVDPIVKEGQSPYGCFSNNPICNIDPFGDSDSSLSNKQLTDAVGIAVNTLKEAKKTGSTFSKEARWRLIDAAISYGEKNQLSYSEVGLFKLAVETYANGLSLFGTNSLSDVEKVLNSKIDDYHKLSVITKQIISLNRNALGVITIAANVALAEVTGAVGMSIGRGTRKMTFKAPEPDIALRHAYENEVDGIKNLVKALHSQEGTTTEGIARTVHMYRRTLGLKYKALTPPTILESIYKRNLEKYGDKLGPTIDFLRSKGKSWDEIIESASRPGGKDLNFKQ
ncbi:MAG: hypothetical protein ABIX01_14910 [Chitinophagaceae bacterium]